MFNTSAYKEWKDLFDENVSNVWQNESIPILKKLSMVVFSLKREIKKIEEELDTDVLSLRKNVEQAEHKQNEIMEPGPSILNGNNKENIQLPKHVTRVSPKTQSYTSAIDTIIDSPEIFHNAEATLSGSTNSKNESDSILISDDEEKSTLQSESPEIKKKKRNYFSQKRLHRHKLRDSNSPTVSFLRGLSSLQKDDSRAKQSGEESKESGVGEEKSSMDFLQGLLAHTQKAETSIQPRKPTNKNGTYKEPVVLTPLKKVCDVDMSVVQCTPEPKSLLKPKEKLLTNLSRKSKKEKRTTLTQMFANSAKLKELQKNSRVEAMVEENYDSDETHFDPKVGTQMGFTHMVSYMNTDPPLRDKSETYDKSRDQNTDANTEDILKIMEDVSYGDFEDNDNDNDNTLNSAIIEEDEKQEEVEAPQRINEFLAKAQNVPKYQLEAEPVVRGKARQNLPGWACNDCARFYLKQGLNPDQILELNKCSKHRGAYKPREDTLPGYWDMNMITQETPKKS